MIPHMPSKANKPYISGYDAQKRHNFITYFDCTNMYGKAMTKPLPITGFCWLNRNEIDETGYILEVDLSYPQHLHDLHSDYPLVPETRNVTDDMLSPYC